MADAYLAHPDRLRRGGDRYTTLVLCDEDALTGDNPHGSCTLDDGSQIVPDTITGHYAGDPFDLGYAIANLVDTEHGPGHHNNQIAGGGDTFDPHTTRAI
jgi:hypothetical protein